MIARRFRLPLTPQTKIQGKRLHTPYFSIVVAVNQMEHGRAGVILPKKHQKSAVVRNQTKRLVLDMALEFIKANPKDVLFISKPAITNATKEEIKTVIDDVIKTL